MLSTTVGHLFESDRFGFFLTHAAFALSGAGLSLSAADEFESTSKGAKMDKVIRCI